LESIGSDNRNRCSRSDSFLRRASSPIPRHLAKSAPEMGGHTRDADGFLVPLTPTASAGSRSHQPDQTWTPSYTGSVAPSDASGRSTTRSLVEDPLYRETNLAANGIYLRHPCEPVPDHVAALVDQVGRDRDSQGP
jgi:hypothetical protein